MGASPVGPVLAALYAAEAALAVCAIALHKTSDEPLLALLASRDGAIFAAALICGLAAAAIVVRAGLRARGGGTRWFGMTVAMNAVTVILALALGEAGARLLSTRMPDGRTAVAGVPLLPYDWSAVVARNRELLRQAPDNISYFVPDALLGWTLGPGRRSKNGLYASSAEGIRSAGPGVSYAKDRPKRRIVVVGDSFSFGLEVPFEDSWAHRLEQALGPGTQVLNFGVDAYGVDQAYLRYLRDARPWKPDLVIFGFINHDLYRSMAVYAFVSFPEWGLPFGKPRFVVENGKLELLNTPVLPPEQILQRASVFDLPFVRLDRGFQPRDWRWHSYYGSRLARLVLSRFEPAPVPGAKASDAALAELNAALFAAFVETAKQESSIPYPVYFPSRGDFSGQNRLAKDGILETFRERHVEHGNLTDCIAKVGEQTAFIAGRPHYSPAGNAAVAACLEPAVRALLASAASSPRR
ncbi:MAG TPA: SGNH/GDSL hydrolase family protein [Burkholderiales bacterium]|nr:SGNH/GDSL hydrolase family protein [Burkholderiales bacterium]